MVVDCSVIVTVQPTAKIATEEDKVQELLFPARHNITLPLNGLNILFNACETAFNHTTQIATDRCVFSPPLSIESGRVTLFFCSAIFFSTSTAGLIFPPSNRISIPPPPT
jgi:hypothetical protein